ncbi:MAG: hypothetical protein FWG35_07165, partial [Spirochaetaceae bacterium]|nr:hypothetical protein [Spirochaetaceae bacterium]
EQPFNLNFNGRMHIITLELAKAEKLAREKAAGELGAAEAWAVFLRYHAEKEKRSLVNEILKAKEDIAMAGETVQAFTQEEIEWFRNESKLKYELDMLSRQAREARLEREASERGLSQGLEKGLEEGLEKGLEKGREEGLAKGRAEALREAEEKNRREKHETARKMKAAGLSVSQIETFTGLPPEEIEKL